MSAWNKKTIEDARNLARYKSGKCITEIYTNSKNKMEWECEHGHRWFATYMKIQQGQWCPKCATNRRRNTIEDCDRVALSNGGKCVSRTYVRSDKHLLWECSVGHQWSATYHKILEGRWCPQCYKNRVGNSIDDCVAVAHKNGGKCISRQYCSNHEHLIWECASGHQWSATYANISHGKTWCPVCKCSRSQDLCASIISNLLNEKPLKNIRPYWLRNPNTGRNLEIDMYFPNNKVAVEYNGEQHYKTTYFNSVGDSLDEIRKRDRLKKNIIKSSTDMVKSFIIFTYRNVLSEENIRSILVKRGVL